MADETIYRVVCPDGHPSSGDTFRTLNEATKLANRIDQLHDKAMCDQPHIIEYARWRPVKVNA